MKNPLISGRSQAMTESLQKQRQGKNPEACRIPMREAGRISTTPFTEVSIHIMPRNVNGLRTIILI